MTMSIIENVSTAFKLMHNEYRLLLSEIYPARGTSGFVERNLTYRFCKFFEQRYIVNKDTKCYSWMEYPLEKFIKDGGKKYSYPHIDSVIFVFEPEIISIIYIEAKRITEGNYDAKYKSIIRDINRLKDNNNRAHIKDKEYFYNKNRDLRIDEYVFFVADAWIGKKTRSEEVLFWWHEKLPAEVGFSGNHIFSKMVKDYGSSRYHLLGIVDQISD